MKTVGILVGLLVTALCTGIGLHAQEKMKESCTSAKCHATMGKDKFVHGPVAANDCSPCHELVKGETHKFKPITNAEALCTKCHEPMVKKTIVHAPVTKGQCTACHNPHQSKQKYQLRSSTIADMCFTCHKRDAFKKKFAHGPAAEGDCIACHTPHSSDKPKLLVQEGKELCFQCHTDLKEAFAQAKHVHKPAAESCLNCHNPHSNDAQFMLAKDVPSQCFDCHKDIQEHLAKVIVKHGAVDTDKKCLNCHTPHAAPYAAQLKDEPMALCLSCHDREIETPQSGKLADMKALFDNNKEWHGPVRERDCSGCHDTHGSENFRILRQYYPKEFYTSFSQDQYELCFSCHEPTLVQDAKTTTLTGFRDGDRNLHFLHVNKKVKGRTCRSCHETHASQQPRHIRESVPFGQWMLPIKFEKTANGGKCSPGCHTPQEYSRSISEASKK